MTPSTSSHTRSLIHSAALTLLTQLFPTTSPPFLASCVAHYLSGPRSTPCAIEEVVERVSEKVLEEREGRGRETEGERVAGWIATTGSSECGEIVGREEVRRAFRAEKGRGKEGGSGGTELGRKRTRTRRRVDETLARNLALIRLHALFPLEPISSLRSLVLGEKESFLSKGVEEVLRSQVLRGRRERERREKERRAGGFFWREMWGTLFPSAPSRADAKGKDVAHDEADEIPPVLTAGDLLHSLSYNAALSSHFRSLFPLLSSTKPGRIAEVVEREGGTYEGMRGRLEEEELRAEAMRGKGRRGWWTRLIGLQDSETEEEGGKGKQRERQERRDVHPLLRREVEEFWRTREGRSEVVPATTTSTSAIANPPNPDDECQCCFAPISPDPAHSVSCSPSPSSPSSASTDVHSFCHSCLAALIRTYTFDGAPIPDSLLTDGSIPCFAASSSPCPHRIPSSSLSHVLDPALRTALDRRTLETTVDRLAASGANLARCPFCPYAVMRDSTDSAGPISSVFVPAWVRTLPPTFWEVAKTAVGLVCLLGLVVVGCVVVLVFGGSAKLERAYDELYPSPSSPSILDDPDQRATPLLSLQTHLLLAPHHSPILILSHIRTLVSRILSVKFGRNTVFVCGASGAVARGGWDGGAREEGWLRRLEGVQEVQWDEDQEEEGEEGVVEERRRARLVEYLWPSEADEDGEGKREEGAWKSCGRLSCTLCFAALNPSAPSLHRCTSPSSTSSSAPSEQAQAEDSLRLAIEKAMSDAVSWVCGRCGARGRKEVGVGACNKVTCRCGTAYCHLCHDAIPPSVGYTHFCQHPHDPHTGTCERGCGKCGLWTEPDERSRVESARRAAQRKWALDHPDWAEKVNLSSTSLKRVGPDLDVDSLTEQAWDVYDAVVETVARMQLS